MDGYYTSIGALVLKSELIVRGVVGEQAGTWKADIQNMEHRGNLVGIEGARVLYGPSLGSDTVEMALWEHHEIPAQGTEVIIFLARRWSAEIETAGRRVSIEEASRPQAWDHWKLFGGERGVIDGDSDRLDYIEQVIEEYVGYLKGELDFVAYVRFLYGLSQSPDERVRIDGWWLDWRRLCGWEEWQDNIGEALEDGLLPDDVVDRIERIRARVSHLQQMQNERTRSREMMDREDVKAIFEDAKYYVAIESGDRNRIVTASRVMGELSREELAFYSDLWVHHMRPLLRSDDEDIRLLAASLLSLIGDPAGAPVMIQRLRDKTTTFPSALIGELQRATGQDFPYDPEASEDVRESQIRVWEEWWEREGELEEMGLAE